jgi:hypothetical protein
LCWTAGWVETWSVVGLLVVGVVTPAS